MFFLAWLWRDTEKNDEKGHRIHQNIFSFLKRKPKRKSGFHLKWQFYPHIFLYYSLVVRIKKAFNMITFSFFLLFSPTKQEKEYFSFFFPSFSLHPSIGGKIDFSLYFLLSIFFPFISLSFHFLSSNQMVGVESGLKTMRSLTKDKDSNMRRKLISSNPYNLSINNVTIRRCII